MTDPLDQELDGLFNTLRAREAPLSAALLDRITADAADAMPPPPPARVPTPSPAPQGQGLWQIMGGWAGGAVLAASALIGVSLGAAGLETLGPIGTDLALLTGGAIDTGDAGLEGAVFDSLDSVMVDG